MFNALALEIFKVINFPELVFCRWGTSAKVIFYCHFPDQLLTDRTTFLKRLYRTPLDWLEERSTGLAHLLLVNSHFTGMNTNGKFHTVFDKSYLLHFILRCKCSDYFVTFWWNYIAAKIFKDTFKSLSHMETHVLYPSLDTAMYDKVLKNPLKLDASSLPSTAELIFLSINRYERKKNIRLAIEALGNAFI